MNPLQILAAQPGVPRLGWTLLHFVWQGVTIAAMYAVAQRRARRSDPHVRYLLGCVALAAMAAAPLVTWWMLDRAAAGLSTTAPPVLFSATATDAVHNLPAAIPPGVSAATAAPLLSWVVAIWLVGATAFWSRLIGG